jgi:peptide/nickel transport system permease protein
MIAAALARLLRSPTAVVCALIILLWCAVAAIGPAIAPQDPFTPGTTAREAPSARHWFGTDQLGRDVLSRVLAGARISVLLGISGVALGIIPGTALGLLGGYCGGWIDVAAMRLVDAMLAFPGVLLALVVIAALGPSIATVAIAIGVATVPQYARLVRGSVLAIKVLPYIEAARVIGARPLRIVFGHVLRNAYAPLLILTTLQVGNAILIGSGLSFLGLGAQPPAAEWGLMAAQGRDVLGRAWWISTFPGLAIVSLAIACNLLGDALRGVLDPRLRA